MKLLKIKILGILAVSFFCLPFNFASAEDYEGLSIYHLPAEWQTQNGNVIKLSELKGNTLVAVMVYTSCQSACPVLIGEMKNIEAKVKERVSGDVKYLLVSIDPETDTPERLQKVSIDYGLTGDQWLLLRGNQETTREFANLLAVKYKQISPIDFSHSNIISVFDKQGKLIHQREGLSVDSAETIKKIVEAIKKN